MIAILLRFLPHLIGLGLLVAGWLYADRACWSTACKSERTQNGALRTRIEAAQKRSTDLALEWAAVVQREGDRLNEQRKESDAAFSALADRARRAGGDRVVPVAVASPRLWDDAARRANGAAEETPAAGQRETGPVVPGPAEAYVREADLNEFVTLAAAAYDATNRARLTCIAIYEGTE